MGQFEAFVGVNLWTALFVLLNTLLIFFVARKYLFGPVTAIIAQRQQEIDGLYAQAEDARDTARELQREYQEKLSLAAATGDQLVTEAAVRARGLEADILRDANARAAAIRAKAAEDIAREQKKVLNEAKDEICVIALAIAGKVVERELNAADHARLLEGFLAELEG